MPEGTWKCEKCGQLYTLEKAACPICRITRVNRDVVGKIETPERSPKPPSEKIDVVFPFSLKDARFNLPLDRGAVWSSGRILATADGFFLLTDKDGLDGDALARNPPPAAGPVGPLSIFIPRAQISRIVHQKLAGFFIEIQGKQKIPIRLDTTGWTDLDIICDQVGIPRS
jgi:hypothetical protein